MSICLVVFVPTCHGMIKIVMIALSAFVDTGCIILKWTKLNGSKEKEDQYFVELWCLVASGDLDI